MVEMNIINFSIVYLLLIVILLVMKKAKIDQTKLLIIASFRMTIQLALAGFILTYIFKNPHPIFTVIYLVAMISFTIYLTLKRNNELNRNFKFIVGASQAAVGVLMLLFFIIIIAKQSIFNPQYAIPISGMIMGNTLTGMTLGLKTFQENLQSEKSKIESLINLGVEPQSILTPIASKSLETAILPTLNSMLGMGIVSLPGMMTGQILSGTVPTTAILYQIAIMITIASTTCLSVFISLFLGCRTLYNDRKQFDY